MNLRSGLAALGLGVVGAVINRSLAESGGQPSPGIEGNQLTYRWRGMDIEYTVAGDPDAPPVVCLHDVGITGSSNEFQPLATALSDDYRVIVPDFPGYGRSDRPPLRYSARLYRSFVATFLNEIPTEPPVVIASGLSGVYAASELTAGDATQLVLICPLSQGNRRSQLTQAALRAPVIGTAMYNLLTSRSGLQAVRQREYYDSDRVDEKELAYRWQVAHQPGARYAPAARVGGFLDPEIDLSKTLTDHPLPVTLLWGRDATTPPLRDGRTLAETADVRLLVVDAAKSRPHVEHPTVVFEALAPELRHPDG